MRPGGSPARPPRRYLLRRRRYLLRPRRYRLRPVSLGGVRPGINLDQALRLADALDDEALAHKLELRK